MVCALQNTLMRRRQEMTREWFTMWFQDGSGRTAILGRRQLRKYAKQYDFDADEVIREGEIEFIDKADGQVVGGVFKEAKQ